MELMQKLCAEKYQRLLEKLKYDIVTGPKLSIPDTYWRFYMNTYWPKYVMGTLILQLDDSVEAIQSEAQEKYGGKFEFNKSLSGLCLRLINFISV